VRVEAIRGVDFRRIPRHRSHDRHPSVTRLR
jgi:hypothetical protein